MRRSNLTALMAIAAGVLAGSGAHVQTTEQVQSVKSLGTVGTDRSQPALPQRTVTGMQSLFDAFNGIRIGNGRGGYPNGPGWTVAHVKRMARKRRNQQRHKAACRRKGGA